MILWEVQSEPNLLYQFNMAQYDYSLQFSFVRRFFQNKTLYGE